MLEDTADDIGESDSQRHTYEKGDSTAPAVFIPNKTEYEEVERYPHRSTRNALHNGIHHRPAIEVEPKKKSVVESVHTILLLAIGH